MTPTELHADLDESQELTLAHIEEMCLLYSSARMAAETFTEAVHAQADRTGISKSALRRYVTARVKDNLEGLDAEKTDIETLLEIAE